MGAANPEFQALLEAMLATLRPRVAQTLALTYRQSVSASDYIKVYTETIDALFAFDPPVMARLEAALSVRRDDARNSIVLMLGAPCCWPAGRWQRQW